MILLVNGEPREVAACDLDALVAELELEPSGVATALNREFVPRGERGATLLRAHDAVEILSPMQGG
ncbi:sulfur carrier protein ThiS [Aureimonas jatrophae]|uniref:Sulfur carrier protein n=1 Tax=Aureimonas jatrophae TaxID=1166073 RepID=A0A1H0CB29_9HYPH|nr:sulfur carrier protein ThiS [Aureimonas jatrophae]MBB3949152.1 sulfur carrier protein [Aureimonas jatrophae]SDN55062.1 sulfur carrier protein [Aureimonas jatrophae]